MDTEALSYERHASVARLLHKSQSRLVAVLDKTLESFGFTAAEYAVMSTLSAGRCDTAAQLCREICYSAAAMTRMLDRLERKRLVRRLPHPASRRARLLELTEEGRRVHARMHDNSAASFRQLMVNFDSAELNRFEAMLDRMLVAS